MHRGGTSLATGLLQTLGAELGSPLIASNEGNPLGYFEHKAIVACHDRILASLGLDWHSPDVLVFPREGTEPRLAEQLRQIGSTLERQLLDRPLSAVKDPRLCRLLPLWRGLLESRGLVPGCLLALRHPNEVASSLAARDGFPSEKSQLLWLRYMLEAEAGSRGLSRAFVRYDELLADPFRELQRIGRELDIQWPYDLEHSREAIEELVQPQLRRHHASRSMQELHPWVRSAYRALLQLACGSNVKRSQATLDRLRAELDRGARLFDAAVRDERGRLAIVVDSLQGERDGLNARLRETDAASALQGTQVERLEAGLREARDRSKELEAQAIERERRAARSEGELTARCEELEARREEVKRGEGVVADLQRANEGLRADRAGLQERAAELAAGLESQRVRAERAATDLCAEQELRGAAESGLAALQNRVNEAERRAQVFEQRAREFEDRSRTSAERADAAVARVQGLEEHCAELEEHASELGHRLRASAERAESEFERADAAVARVQGLEQHCTELEERASELRHRLQSSAERVDSESGRADKEAEQVQGLEERCRELEGHASDLRYRLQTSAEQADSESERADVAAERVQSLEERCRELGEQVSEIERVRMQTEQRMAAAQHRVSDLEEESFYYAAVVRSMESSRSWRLTAPFRLAFLPVRRALELYRVWRPRVTPRRVRRSLALLVRGRFRILRDRIQSVASAAASPPPTVTGEFEGTGGRPVLSPPPAVDAYEAWQQVNRVNERRVAWLADRLRAAGSVPSLSLVMPLHKPSMPLLGRSLDSLRKQVHGDSIEWELCAYDDGSDQPEIERLLASVASEDGRIRIFGSSVNQGIAAATNSAAEHANGDFLVFIDQGDELAHDALAEIALALAEHPDADLLYTDDDKIEIDGRRHSPQFKPGWSPELLLSFSYTSHALVVRRSVYESLGGMRCEFDGSQDYDFMLRAAEVVRAVAHIPRVLYHWRVEPGSTAASGRAKPESLEAGRRAVQSALDRRGIEARAELVDWARAAGCGVFASRFPDTGPRVAILIATRNQPELLGRCVDSIERLTRYRDYEIVVLDNESDDPAAIAHLASLEHRVIRIGNPEHGFSFSALNNRAAEQIDCDLLLFLNDDTEVRSAEWLGQMVGWLHVEGVGAVGARLVYPDGRLQHAGIVHGLYDGMAGPAFKLQPEWDHGPLGQAAVTRNCAAVTAACMLVRRKEFLELGGFDEKLFAVAYNDVDFCYRLRAAGRRVVVCAEAELCHHEGASRGFVDDPAEPAAFRRHHADKVDPYYSLNLSLDDERFSIAARTQAPVALPPIRTLHFSHNLAWEGASLSLLELVVGLRRAGVIDPTVFSPQDGALREAYEEAGIPVVVQAHPLSDVYTEDLYVRRCEDLAAWLRDGGFELVHANTLQCFYGIDGASRTGIPSLWHVRESEDWRHYFDFLEPPLGQRAIDCFAHPYAVVFVARATRAVFEALGGRHNFATIPNALDPERAAGRLGAVPRAQARRQLGIDSGRIAFLNLGTVCERKGQHEAVEAFAQLDPSLHDAELWIVGDRASPYSDALHGRIEELPDPVRERVRVVGETGSVAEWFAAADAFVFTSRFESHPRVVLEAMSAGLPIVSTPVFGVPEQVQEGVNALFYPVGQPDVLARHLASLAGDAALRERLAASSHAVLGCLPSHSEMLARAAELFRGAWLSGESR